jgi:hypothetical protein
MTSLVILSAGVALALLLSGKRKPLGGDDRKWFPQGFYRRVRKFSKDINGMFHIP